MTDSNEVVTEDLKILNQRLTDSTYLEDRIEALENIHKYVQNDCNSVGIHCLSSLMKSLKYFVHKYHFEILTKIFNSLNGKEFVEIFLENEEYLKIIINAKNRRGTDLFILLCNFNRDKICKSFDDEKTRGYFTKLNENHLNLLSFLLDDQKLKKNLVQEGLIEKLFVFLDEKRAVKKCLILLEIILRESHFCQNYFNRNCLDEFLRFEKLSIFHFFNVLVHFLDTSNRNFFLFQERLTEREFIERAIELKRYDFIFKYFYGRYQDNNEEALEIYENTTEKDCSLTSIMKDVDLYSEFLQTPYRCFLLRLMFKMKPTIPENVDINNRIALFYLCNIIYLKYHDENRHMSKEEDQINKEDKMIEKYIENCHIITKELNSHDRAYQLAVLTVLIMAEENDQALFREMINNDDEVDMILRGASVLINQPEGFCEEYLLKCVRQYRKFLVYEKDENLHQKVLDFLEKICRKTICSLEDKINSRESHKIVIQGDAHKTNQEIDSVDYSPEITPKMSTRDAIQSFVTDFSKRFLSKGEGDENDDTFNL